MTPLRVALVASPGPDRADLLSDLGELDCEIVADDHAAEPDAAATIIIVAADGEGGWSAVDRLRHDPRPLLVVSDQPRRRMMSLSARAGNAMMISGAGGPAALRLAIGMCTGLDGA